MNQNMTNAAIEMRNTFRYVGEEPGWDSWRILKDTPRKGDCEDFALTTLWLVAGQSIIRFWWYLVTFQAIIWHVRTPRGVGHAELWFRGQSIDNISPNWKPEHMHKRWFPYLWPLVAFKMLTRRLNLKTAAVVMGLTVALVMWATGAFAQSANCGQRDAVIEHLASVTMTAPGGPMCLVASGQGWQVVDEPLGDDV